MTTFISCFCLICIFYQINGLFFLSIFYLQVWPCIILRNVNCTKNLQQGCKSTKGISPFLNRIKYYDRLEQKNHTFFETQVYLLQMSPPLRNFVHSLIQELLMRDGSLIRTSRSINVLSNFGKSDISAEFSPDITCLHNFA